MNRYSFLAASAALAAGATGSLPASAQSQTIGQLLNADAHFSKFVAWAKASGVQSRLSGGGPYTVFAPVNAAFGSLTPGLDQAMLKPQNQGRLLSVVLYHVIPGAITHGAFKSGTIKAMNGQLLSISDINGVVRVNNYGIAEHGITASNGIIYPCSAVLVPPMTESM